MIVEFQSIAELKIKGWRKRLVDSPAGRPVRCLLDTLVSLPVGLRSSARNDPLPVGLRSSARNDPSSVGLRSSARDGGLYTADHPFCL